ncbi:MAG TPA: hypothetical protein VGX72_10335 [Solirubrobacteraceae bacterium]|jgi:hypothetical protein|nr:hypothetical protein [Solirubrobacteraceae bacterium]
MSARTRHLDRGLRYTACLLLAATLSVGQGLLSPASAPAMRRPALQPPTGEEPGVTAPGEPSRESAREERRAMRHGRCHVEMSLTPSRLTAGESATVAGSVTCADSTEASEQTVTVYQRTTATQGFIVAGTTSTEASGAFRLTTEAVDANSVFYASAQDARSKRATVRVTPLVTISGPPEETQLAAASRSDTSARAADTLTFTGIVSPEDAGATVVLQRESATVSENWRRIGLGHVGADGAYSISHTFARAGSATVRVVVRGNGLPAVASEPLTYEVAPRQSRRLTVDAVKPLLTAQVSATSIQAGQRLTFSGTVTPAHAGQPVYLERQNVSGIGFHVVDVTTLTASGSYSLEHAVSGAGAQVFRIKVPGDHERQSVASELLKIQVTPAAADPLEPEAPAGSALTSKS